MDNFIGLYIIDTIDVGIHIKIITKKCRDIFIQRDKQKIPILTEPSVINDIRKYPFKLIDMMDDEDIIHFVTNNGYILLEKEKKPYGVSWKFSYFGILMPNF